MLRRTSCNSLCFLPLPLAPLSTLLDPLRSRAWEGLAFSQRFRRIFESKSGSGSTSAVTSNIDVDRRCRVLIGGSCKLISEAFRVTTASESFAWMIGEEALGLRLSKILLTLGSEITVSASRLCAIQNSFRNMLRRTFSYRKRNHKPLYKQSRQHTCTRKRGDPIRGCLRMVYTNSSFDTRLFTDTCIESSTIRVEESNANIPPWISRSKFRISIKDKYSLPTRLENISKEDRISMSFVIARKHHILNTNSLKLRRSLCQDKLVINRRTSFV